MGLLKRARSIQGASRSDPAAATGLLRKSLAFINKIVQPQPEQLTEGQRRYRLWSGLEELEGGIEYPGRFFALVKEQLQLQRAAIMLFDSERMVFAPWALHGFDATTSHRLRIPLRANDTMNRLTSGKVHLLSTPEELQPFSQFFSFREFSLIANLALVPFIHESRFMGLFLSAEADERNLEIFAELSERAGRHFYIAREKHLEGAKREPADRPESVEDRVRKALESLPSRHGSPLLMRINTTALVESVKTGNPYIDPFRLSQDISRVVRSLFQTLGSVFQIDRGRLLILVGDPGRPIHEGDSELLLHHLKATLGSLLPVAQVELDEQVRLPAPEIEEVLTQLAEIV